MIQTWFSEKSLPGQTLWGNVRLCSQCQHRWGVHVPPTKAECGAARISLRGASLACEETVWVEGLRLGIDAGIVQHGP